jgi:Ca-activated chloride channel family protein
MGVGAQQQPTFRAATDAVAVEVSVRDRGRPITNLQAGDFEILDNGVTQQAVQVSYDTQPIDVTVILDVSFSVTGTLLQRLSRAVRQMMGDLRPVDRLKLVTFNNRVSRVVDFTTDIDTVDRAIQDSAAGGGSSVWDALAVAVASTPAPDRRQLMMIFSDGADTSSVLTPLTLMRVIERTNASIAAVVPSSAFVVPSAGGGVRVVPGTAGDILRQLAVATGGQFIPVTSVTQDLTETFQRVLNDFRSAYVLHFIPTGVDAKGFHTLTVTVRGKGGYVVKARRGYFR